MQNSKKEMKILDKLFVMQRVDQKPFVGFGVAGIGEYAVVLTKSLAIIPFDKTAIKRYALIHVEDTEGCAPLGYFQ